MTVNFLKKKRASTRKFIVSAQKDELFFNFTAKLEKIFAILRSTNVRSLFVKVKAELKVLLRKKLYFQS